MESSTIPTNVLFVDDEEPMRELASRSIEISHPHIEVTTLGSPGEALDHLGSEPVDCVVTDYSMPGMDGMAFLESIRASNPKLPVIFFTGKGSEELASEAINAGVTDYIPKEPGTQVFTLLGSRIDTLVRINRAERRANEADARVRELFDRVSDAVLSLADDGTVTYLNDGAESIFGPADELTGERLVDRRPTLQDTAFTRLVEEAQASQQTQSREFELPVGDRHVSVTAYPAEDGVSVFVQDLTPLREREAEISELTVELEESQSKFRVLKSKFSRPVPPNR